MIAFVGLLLYVFLKAKQIPKELLDILDSKIELFAAPD